MPVVRVDEALPQHTFAPSAAQVDEDLPLLNQKISAYLLHLADFAPIRRTFPAFSAFGNVGMDFAVLQFLSAEKFGTFSLALLQRTFVASAVLVSGDLPLFDLVLKTSLICTLLIPADLVFASHIAVFHRRLLQCNFAAPAALASAAAVAAAGID